MSFFESFVGGAAEAGTGMLQTQMKNDAAEEQAKRMAQFQEQLAIDRARTINAMNQENKIADEKRANEPLERIGGLIASKRGQEVPMEAAPVTTLSGKGEAFDGQPLTMGGLQGDPAKLRKQAEAMPDGEDKTNILKQLDNQMASDTKTAKDAVAGKTRKLTADEAEKAALEDAMEKDPVAYAEYQKRIGAPKRAERREDTREARAASQDETTNRRLDIQEQFNAERAKHQDAMEKLNMERVNRQDGKQSDQMDKAELQSKRLAITSVLKDIGTQEDKLQVRLADPMLDEKQKAILVSQMKTLDADRNAAKNFLYEMSGVEVKPVDKAYPPAPPAAVQRLRDNPDRKADYEAMFGPGSADAVLKKAAPSIIAQAKTPEQPVATTTAAPAQAEPVKPLSNLEQIQANNLEAVKPLAAQVKQAEAALAAVARSGDATATSRYARELQDLRTKLESEVNARFGNGAKAILASLQ